MTPRSRGPSLLRRWGLLAGARVRIGWRRVRGSFLPTAQASLGAAVAWFIAADVLGHENPVFAPIATWVALGFKIDRVPRKVAELGAGASVGVLLGELFATWFSTGPAQIGVLLLLSAMVGRFLDRGDLFTVQAGVNSLVILSMASWPLAAGGGPGRWLDALVGAGVAFVVAVLVPRNPTSRPRRYAGHTLSELATMLEMVARGLESGDVELLADVSGQRRVVAQEATGWEEALATAREVVGLNPGLWKHRAEIAELGRLLRLSRRARRSADMLARQALGLTEEVGRLPVVGGLVADTARAAQALAGSVRGWSPPLRARELLLDVARRSGPGEIPGDDWRPLAIAAVIRAVVVDLLQLTGLSREQARDALADTWGRPFADPVAGGTVAEGDDGASGFWG